MIPFGAGPSSLAEPVLGRHIANGTVPAALIAPWNIEGSQMLPLCSYSQSHKIPTVIANTQKTSIPTTGNPFYVLLDLWSPSHASQFATWQQNSEHWNKHHPTHYKLSARAKVQIRYFSTRDLSNSILFINLLLQTFSFIFLYFPHIIHLFRATI